MVRQPPLSSWTVSIIYRVHYKFITKPEDKQLHENITTSLSMLIGVYEYGILNKIRWRCNNYYIRILALWQIVVSNSKHKKVSRIFLYVCLFSNHTTLFVQTELFGYYNTIHIRSVYVIMYTDYTFMETFWWEREWIPNFLKLTFRIIKIHKVFWWIKKN